jgi:dihydroorotate dehydrogenase
MLEILSSKDKKWINSAGTAGFAPTRNLIEKFPEIGLFVTNPVSYLPRIPANERCVVPFEGGFLVHNGYPNPGFRSILKNYKNKWENALLPICISLLSDMPNHVEKIIRSVENIDNIVAIELCLDPSFNFNEIHALINAALGELPIILSVPYEIVFMEWIGDLFQPEILAVSIQAPRGSIYHHQKLVQGRMYGSSMFPLTLRAIQHLSQYETVIIAGVGAFHNDDPLKIYQAGAQHFQPHELIWRDYN